MATRKGATTGTTASSGFMLSYVNKQYLSPFTMSESGTLATVGAFINVNGSQSIRMAVYQGGTTSNPAGATKIWDSGEITPTSTSNAFYSVAATGSLTTGPTWIGITGSNSNGAQFLYSENASYQGDLEFRGSERSSVDSSVAYESTITDGNWTEFTTGFVAVFLTYDAGASAVKGRSLLLGVG